MGLPVVVLPPTLFRVCQPDVHCSGPRAAPLATTSTDATESQQPSWNAVSQRLLKTLGALQKWIHAHAAIQGTIAAVLLAQAHSDIGHTAVQTGMEHK